MRRTHLIRSFGAAVLACASLSASAGELLVSAASSLTNAFKEAALAYEAQHPGVKVAFNFAASGVLLQQIAKGAPVDVFASADQETMDAAQKQGLVDAAGRRDFVRNSLVLVLPSDSKFHVKRLQDLAQPAITRVAISNPASVPVGRYSQHALEAAQLWPAVQAKAINTQNVRQSLDYVARGEVDAGFVYNTDAALMKDKVTVAFEVPLDLPVRYPLAAVKGSANGAEARRFVEYLVSPAAQAIFARYGFQKP